MKKYVLIHEENHDLNDLKSAIAECQDLVWTKEPFKARPALRHRWLGFMQEYDGQEYNSKTYKLIEDGWEHDHCEICGWALFESDDPEHSIGYRTGNNWICSECYDRFLTTLETLNTD